MGYLKEKVSYIKGLAEGLNINEASNEGRLIKAIIEVLNDMAVSVEDVEEMQEQLSEQVDTIDEDLGELEKVIYEDIDSDDDYDEDYDDDECYGEVECPHCGEKFSVTENMIDDEGDTIECPNCHKEMEFEWECECEECHDKKGE